MTHENMYRSLPPSLAPIVAELEFRNADIVSAGEIAQHAGVPAGSAAARNIVRRMVEARWLKRLPVRGQYEFLPSRGGPFSRSDRLDALRAAIARTPSLRVQVALHAAAFIRGFASRPPDDWDVLVARSVAVAPALRQEYRIHWVTPDRLFGAEPERGVPVSTPDRLLIDVALWPAAVGPGIRVADHWLGAALRKSSPKAVVDMLRRLDSPAATARAGYLASAFGRADIADEIRPLRRPSNAVPLIPGLSGGRPRHDRAFNVDDPVGAGTVG